jgi:alpha-L-fucosidase
MDYFDMINEITSDENKVKEWATIAKTKNVSYIILTSKHHDGVCLFDTNTTHHKSELDICKVFSDECKCQYILFGFYYSWFEFGIPFTKKYFSEYCLPQLHPRTFKTAQNPLKINEYQIITNPFISNIFIVITTNI